MYRFCLFFLLLFDLNPTNASSQSLLVEIQNDTTMLYVKYAQYSGFENDSIYRKLVYGSLFLGRRGAVYTFQVRSFDEILKERERNIKDERIKKIVLEETRKYRDWERHLTDVYVKSYNSPKYLVLKKFDKDYYWLPDTARFEWKLQADFKKIENYHCQKAIMPLTGGGEITAWFTVDIPINAGPYYISGLPGLVLEYFNSTTKSFYKAVRISSEDFPDQRFREWLTGAVITHEKYKELMAESTKNYENLQRMIQRGAVEKEN